MTDQRQLDVEIAKAMGLKVVALDWPCGLDPESGCYMASPKRDNPASWYTELGPVYIVRDDDWPPRAVEGVGQECAMVFPVPHYSSDIAAAWKVVEWLNDLHYQFHLSQSGQYWFVSCYAMPVVEEDGTETRHVGNANSRSIAEAICLAALRACKEEERE